MRDGGLLVGEQLLLKKMRVHDWMFSNLRYNKGLMTGNVP
jgi:hypothetical protein